MAHAQKYTINVRGKGLYEVELNPAEVEKMAEATALLAKSQTQKSNAFFQSILSSSVLSDDDKKLLKNASANSSNMRALFEQVMATLPTATHCPALVSTDIQQVVIDLKETSGDDLTIHNLYTAMIVKKVLDIGCKLAAQVIEQHTKAKEDLTSQIQTLNNSLRAKATDYKRQLANANKQAQSEYQQLKEEITALKHLSNSSGAQEAECKEQLEKATQQALDDYKRLEEKHKDCQKSLSSLEAKLAERNASSSELTKKISRLSAQLNDAKQELTRRNTDIQAIQKKHNTLSQDLKEANKKLQNSANSRQKDIYVIPHSSSIL